MLKQECNYYISHLIQYCFYFCIHDHANELLFTKSFPNFYNISKSCKNSPLYALMCPKVKSVTRFTLPYDLNVNQTQSWTRYGTDCHSTVFSSLMNSASIVYKHDLFLFVVVRISIPPGFTTVLHSAKYVAFILC